MRTQPHTELQGQEFGRFILAQGAKSVYLIMPQTPFTETMFKAIRETVEPKGVKVASAIIDNKKTSFRSEIDEMMRANPDIFMMGGYLDENIVMAKDLFRANFKGKVMGFAYGITPAFIDGAGKEAAEGIFSIADPSPAFDSSAYAKLKALVKRDSSIPSSARPTTMPTWRSCRWPRARTRPAPRSATTSARSPTRRRHEGR